MKILLYTPHVPKQSIRMDYLISSEPLELEYLYTVLKDKHELSFLEKGRKKTLLKFLDSGNFQMLCISCYITQTTDVIKLSKIIKTKFPEIYIVVGGVHAEVAPEHFFTPDIDVVVFGNHLSAIQAIANAVSSGFHPKDIEGAAFKNSEFKIFETTQKNPELPVADRILFYNNPKRYYYFYYDACATVKTAFCCPGKCTFCFCRKMNGGIYYPRPITDVVDEIEKIPTNNIFIVDDNFLTGAKRLQSFCDEIEKREIIKNFIVYGTADFVAGHPDLMKRLKSNGLSALIVGFEYISDTELHSVNKKSTVEDNEKTIEICSQLGIELFALFICDPEWKHADFINLAKYIRKKDINFATFSTPTILPKTDEAIQKKTVFEIDKLWRYDLLRLHQKPKNISSFSYYLWLYFLYLIPLYKFSTMKLLLKKYGWRKGIVVTLKSAYFGALYFIKILIWK